MINMTMKEGEIVHIKYGDGYWTGKITSVTSKYRNLKLEYGAPIALVKGLNGVGVATRAERELIKKDGEWWDK